MTNTNRRNDNNRGGRSSQGRYNDSRSSDDRGNDGRNRYSRDNRRSGTTDNVKVDQKAVQTIAYRKYEFGFLLISLVVKKCCSVQNIESSIDSVLPCSHGKKKIVISFEHSVDEDTVSHIKHKYKIYSVIFFTRKSVPSNNMSEDEAILHNEVFKAFKSDMFLTINSRVIITNFMIEKMVKFLSKANNNIGIFPKFYNTDDSFVKSCFRFKNIWNLFTPFCNFIKEKHLRHNMMERGEIGYMSIHRVDCSFLDCFLILSEALLGAKLIPLKSNEMKRDFALCKKLYNTSKGGTLSFLPSARCTLINKEC